MARESVTRCRFLESNRLISAVKNGRTWRIYLAEDNPGDVYLVQEALRSAHLDFNLTLFEDGDQAWKWFQRIETDGHDASPDVLLLDLNLPKADGEEVLRSLRETHAWKQLPVVILTSSESPSDKALASRYGARYFQKPSDLDTFLSLGEYVRGILYPGNGGESPMQGQRDIDPGVNAETR